MGALPPDAYLARCAELAPGVMLDIKSLPSQKAPAPDGSEPTGGSATFFRTLAALVEKHGLAQSTVTIRRDPLAIQHLKGRAMVRVTEKDVERIEAGESIALDGKFWFDWPRHITGEMVKTLQDRGALVIPSINVQHYPSELHLDRRVRISSG